MTTSRKPRLSLTSLEERLEPKPRALSPLPAGRFIDLGVYVCDFIGNLVHGEGDFYGKPFVLDPDPWEEYLIRRLFLVDAATGKRIVRRALWVLPKGNGKTELVAAVELAELAGPALWDLERGRPVSRVAPNIPVAAASYDQADRLLGAAADMAGHEDSGLRPFVDVYESEIKLRDRKGRMFKVAAVAGTNDGGLPTGLGADEVHEWEGRKERVHLVIGNSLTKRDQALELNISTPDDARPETLFGRLHVYGSKVASGEIDDPSFLFAWWSAPEREGENLYDPDELRAAIREANPGSFVAADRVAARLEIDKIPLHEFERYHLARLVRPEGSWLPAGLWGPLATPKRKVKKGEKIVLGFDGSYNRDSTGLVGCTPDGFLFVIDAWERPENARENWKIPRAKVDAAVAGAMKKYQVLEMACDPHRWTNEIEGWMETYGEVVVEFPTSAPKRQAPACARFYGAVKNGEGISHDGDQRLSRHLHNAVTKETRDGAYITKETRDSPRKIDLAVAAVMAYDRAMWLGGHGPAKAIAMVLGGPKREEE